ncbi:protein ALWAYS EARLY 2-like [Impatiens glandulifera]|uniref:protein ALWAYS EARLY 2-like n=1 Tax=Impatiens glandulifera TaxID=253017 RepID=UPI001FB12487|nr:protein ALWAYS EARLY 2-like [Impatiens glandulifera]XP_047319381.1 protein ALWAYS EARLY 2-like [Impatiens glandulifera]XP_047319382.1 protein ALWAYS EARLY 2-like [Impatiens glandulifera]
MAPPKKSRGVNKQLSQVDEVSPSKDEDNSKKSLLRKRKFSDMLGLQWTKGELERFYDAYRKHGKDWKKVAVAVRNRSVEMVEALYTMNRAYLSLPEGTASVAGLIAMMTDHYCNMGGSDREQEGSDGEETFQKLQKRSRRKLHPSPSKRTEGHTIPHLHPGTSTSGCLSFLNKGRPNGIGPRAVGKRTPRYPISYSYERANGEKNSPKPRKGLQLKVDAVDDDVAHEVALVLAEASQRGGSPQVSRTPNRGKHSIMPSPAWNGKRKHIGKKVDNGVDEEGLEGGTEAENGDLSRGKSYLREMRDVADGKKGRRTLEKNIEADCSENDDLDDVKEAFSGTEAKAVRSPFHMPKKKNKKVLFGEGEGSAFDALQALADLADLAAEEGSAFQVKDGDDLVDKPPEILSPNRQKERPKSSRVKTKGKQLTSDYEIDWPKTSRNGKAPVLDIGSIPEVKRELSQPISKVSRKKQKAMTSKTPADKVAIDGHPNESQEAEVDTLKRFMIKGKWSSNNSLLQRHGKPVKHPEHSSSSTEQKAEKEDSALSSMQVNMPSLANTTSKVRSKRKSELKEPQKLHLKYSNELSNDQSNISMVSWLSGARNIKEKLSNCMSSHQLRRWCAFEWFYSAVDYPWFAKREFVEYLNHVGLGHVPRLTRVEWGVIRSSLGKPRRFSEQFLREEKYKLNQYRDSVRTHYTELRSGTREGLPTDLARPLSVGQRVVAIHPKTREIHDGSVLTVDHTRCRVQFDRPELGVEFVMDIDCMPQNPFENMPACMARSAVPVDKILENSNELKVTGLLKDQKLESLMKFSSGESSQNGGGPHMSPSSYAAINLKPAKGAPLNVEVKPASNGIPNYQLSLLAHIQVKEGDVQALADLTRNLDKKEALVSELRHMNDDMVENRSNLENSEPFKKQYAAIIVQLNEINEQVSSSLFCLRQRNGYQGNSILALPQPAANLGDTCLSLSLCDHPVNPVQDSGFHVKDIVESSRAKARTLVDAAMQAMLSMNQSENIPERIEETIDYVSNRLPLDDSGLLSIRPSIAPLDITISSTMDSLNEDKLKRNMTDKNDSKIPSELISHCVATLLMIQKCTERQFPPTDVAQILDSAVTSLQPCCSQNLPVYSEIQKCMGIIRNQILALIPT